jgi:hypothetical protein
VFLLELSWGRTFFQENLKLRGRRFREREFRVDEIRGDDLWFVVFQIATVFDSSEHVQMNFVD